MTHSDLPAPPSTQVPGASDGSELCQATRNLWGSPWARVHKPWTDPRVTITREATAPVSASRCRPHRPVSLATEGGADTRHDMGGPRTHDAQ